MANSICDTHEDATIMMWKILNNGEFTCPDKDEPRWWFNTVDNIGKKLGIPIILTHKRQYYNKLNYCQRCKNYIGEYPSYNPRNFKDEPL